MAYNAITPYGYSQTGVEGLTLLDDNKLYLPGGEDYYNENYGDTEFMFSQGGGNDAIVGEASTYSYQDFMTATHQDGFSAFTTTVEEEATTPPPTQGGGGGGSYTPPTLPPLPKLPEIPDPEPFESKVKTGAEAAGMFRLFKGNELADKSGQTPDQLRIGGAAPRNLSRTINKKKQLNTLGVNTGTSGIGLGI